VVRRQRAEGSVSEDLYQFELWVHPDVLEVTAMSSVDVEILLKFPCGVRSASHAQSLEKNTPSPVK